MERIEKQAEDVDDVKALERVYSWRMWARPAQLAPPGDWRYWLILAGRGFGKTRAGAEWVRDQVAQGRRRIALIGPTAADVRDVMIEGQSGLINISHPDERPSFQPSKRRLIWPNGAKAFCYSAEEPQRLRGPQHDAAWADELAAWKDPQAAWDQLQMGLRIGADPRAAITTTPRPIALIRALSEDPHCVVIQKVAHNDDGTITITGIASTGSVDEAGETVTAAAMKAALPDYLRFGALREMHGLSAAGTALRASVDDNGFTHLEALVVDPVAVKKVQAGVYKGLSIGGRVLERDPADRTIITKLKLSEISLVDRPCNPDAVIDMWKADVSEPTAAEVLAECERLAKATGRGTWRNYVTMALKNLTSAPAGAERFHPVDDLPERPDPIAAVAAAIAKAKAPQVRGLPGDASATVAKMLGDMDDLDHRLIRMGAERELEAGCGGVLLKSLPTSPDQTIAALCDVVADLRTRLAKAEARPMPPKTATSTTAAVAKVAAAQAGDEPAEVATYDLWQFRGAALEKVASGLCDVVADLRKRMVRAEVNPSRPSLRMAPGSRSISKVEDVSPGGSNEAERTVTAEELRKYLETLPPEERARIELRAALSRPIQIGRSA